MVIHQYTNQEIDDNAPIHESRDRWQYTNTRSKRSVRSLRNHAVPRVGNYAAVLSLVGVGVPGALFVAARACCPPHLLLCAASVSLRPRSNESSLSRSVVLLCVACSHSGVCWSAVSWCACVWGVFIVSECVVLSLSLVGVGGGVASELDVGTTTHP